MGQVFFCNSSCSPSGRECKEGGLCKQMTGHMGREALCLGRRLGQPWCLRRALFLMTYASVLYVWSVRREDTSMCSL